MPNGVKYLFLKDTAQNSKVAYNHNNEPATVKFFHRIINYESFIVASLRYDVRQRRLLEFREATASDGFEPCI